MARRQRQKSKLVLAVQTRRSFAA
ncbi:hypothetical protein MED222_06430 [Vibrio sp. MED222]|nr:hypothetical protein MED222_06430 [Vibrio sp. MED222]